MWVICARRGSWWEMNAFGTKLDAMEFGFTYIRGGDWDESFMAFYDVALD